MTSGAEEKQKRQRFEKVVVFKNCFTVEEMNRDPCLILRVKEDLRRISAPFGQTQKVNLFDGHPQGVCSVSFINHEGSFRFITPPPVFTFGIQVRTAQLIVCMGNFSVEERSTSPDGMDIRLVSP